MVLGTPGADQQVLLTMQTLLNMIDFGMNVQQAIEAPEMADARVPGFAVPHTMYPGDLSVEARVPESVRKELLARGHKLRVTGPWSDGSLAAIVIDLKTGVISAGADPRTEAYAWAGDVSIPAASSALSAQLAVCKSGRSWLIPGARAPPPASVWNVHNSKRLLMRNPFVLRAHCGREALALPVFCSRSLERYLPDISGLSPPASVDWMPRAKSFRHTWRKRWTEKHHPAS